MDIEYYKSLASAVQRFAAQGKRRLLLTSSGPGEGKSTITAELGRTLARSGRVNVAMIDTDRFNPTVHRLFGLENGRGLGDLLTEIVQFDLLKEDPHQFGVGDWLEFLHLQTRSGRLRISEGPSTFVLTVQKGAVLSVLEENAPAERRLGGLLVGRGHLSAAQLEEALRVQAELKRPLGDVVVRIGYVAPEDLQAALRAQFTERLRRILTMRMPHCAFTESSDGYFSAAAGRQFDYRDGSGIDAHVVQQIAGYLKRPYLAGQVMSYLRDTHLDNLKVMTSGTAPYDLIDSASAAPFLYVLDHLSRAFDVVLIDSPPVAVASPAETIAPEVDGVILVVKADGLDIQVIQRAKELLEKAGATLLGAVLNQVDLRQADPALHYYHAYRREDGR
jgi:Mrp family chromosome partitioning ATPase